MRSDVAPAATRGTKVAAALRLTTVVPAVTVGGILLVVAVRWLAGLGRGAWLDETATHYFVSGSWSDLFDRLALHPQAAPGYYVLLKAGGNLGLPAEAGLRWQSLLALILSSVLLFRLGRHLFGPPAAWASAAIFPLLTMVAYQGNVARPYSLGMLCVVAAALFLVRWMDSGRGLDRAGFVLSCAGIAWVHYVFLIVLAPFLFYAVYRARSGNVRAGSLLGSLAAVGLLVSPLVVAVVRTWRSAGTLSFARPPTLGALAWSLSIPAGILLVIGLLSWAGRVDAATRSRAHATSAMALLIPWALIPPVAAFAVAASSSANIFHPRYYMPMLAAVALLLGYLIQCISSPTLRAALLVTIVAFCAWEQRWVGYVEQDWRGAANAVRALPIASETPVFLCSGLVESLDPVIMNDPRYREYLGSPLVMYPVGGRTILLPTTLRPDTASHFLGLAGRELRSARHVVAIADSGCDMEWFISLAIRGGWTLRELGTFTFVRAGVLERSATGAGEKP